MRCDGSGTVGNMLQQCEIVCGVFRLGTSLYMYYCIESKMTIEMTLSKVNKVGLD